MTDKTFDSTKAFNQLHSAESVCRLIMATGENNAGFSVSHEVTMEALLTVQQQVSATISLMEDRKN